MANKEALAVLVDVGEGMVRGGRMLRAASLLETLLKQKLLFAPSDEVAIVLFGTEETQNELNEQGGDYENITVLQPFDTPRLSTLRDLRPRRLDADDEEQHELEREVGARPLVLPPVLTPSDCESDFVDAMMVALDLIKRRTQGKKTRRRLVLITAAASSCAVDDNDVSTLINLIDQENIDLSVAGIDFDEVGIGRTQAEEDAKGTGDDAVTELSLKRANERTLRHIARQGRGKVWTEAQAHAEIEQSMMKNTRGTASYRGELQVGPSFAIKVHCFALLKPVTFPQLMKESQVAPTDTQQKCCSNTVYRKNQKPSQKNESENARNDDKAGSGVDNTHQAGGDQHVEFAVMCDDKMGDTEVAAEQRINAYPYGSFLTPFSAADEVAAKPELTPGLQCLGLVPSTEVRREWLIGATQVMVAEPDNPRAQVALSAFVKGLHEEGRFMVARLVKSTRSAQALLVLLRPGALRAPARGAGPNSELQPTKVDCFYVDELPFADDVRDTQFGSLGCPAVCDVKLEATASDAEHNEAGDQARCIAASASAAAAVCAYEPSLAQQHAADALLERMQLPESHPQAANALPRNPSIALHLERVYQKAMALRPLLGSGADSSAATAAAQSQAGSQMMASQDGGGAGAGASAANVANVSLAPGLADGIRMSLKQSPDILCHAAPALDEFAAAFPFKAGRNFRKKAGHWTDAQPSKRPKLSPAQITNATTHVATTIAAESSSAKGSGASGGSVSSAAAAAAGSGGGLCGGRTAADAPAATLKSSAHDAPFPLPATASPTPMHTRGPTRLNDSGNCGGKPDAADLWMAQDNSNDKALATTLASTPEASSSVALKPAPASKPEFIMQTTTVTVTEPSSDSDDSIMDLM